MNKISVIVPIYKVENYLNRCLDSLVNQTYKNLEIILVDDGSPDKCPQMCDEWAKKDKRIKVIHKENGGLSSARNAGLDKMTGQYVMFVDSDDYIHKQACEILLNNLEKSDSDISMAGFVNFYNSKKSKEKFYNIDKIKSKVYLKDDVYTLIFNKKIPMIMTAWSKLYKKEIFDKLRFDEGKLHEDEFILHKVMHQCNKFTYCSLPLYNYFQNNSGITGSTFKIKRLDVLDAMEKRVEFTKINRPNFTDDAIFQYIKVHILIYYRAYFAKLDEKIMKDIKQKIDHYYSLGYKNKLINMFYKHPKILGKIIYLKLKLQHVI